MWYKVTRHCFDCGKRYMTGEHIKAPDQAKAIALVTQAALDGPEFNWHFHEDGSLGYAPVIALAPVREEGGSDA